MNKNLKIGLIVVAVVIAAYFAWRWWQNRQQSTIQSPTQAFGTNLNSVAPELVGGSAGPSVGSAPAVSLPVNITLTEPTHSSVNLDSRDTEPQAIPTGRSEKPVQRQRIASGVVSMPNPNIPTQDESAGERGTSDAEQDDMDQMDASTVNTGV